MTSKVIGKLAKSTTKAKTWKKKYLDMETEKHNLPVIGVELAGLQGPVALLLAAQLGLPGLVVVA